ncbi:hypothetical protein G5C51_32465 [Streptomyces sp. A7024]|uniref:Lysozyme n=1 Tax=Streptomyces coryli TaxID=1128680 RepID=A0A6G4U8M7_9ACTN|nr:glycoside hydrolase family 25 protein [Streptomyces coryli]NGN68595.1 hypothetical protein [Streptomyces coryli]
MFRRSTALALGGAAAIVAGALFAVNTSASAAPPDAYPVKGFDTSHHQHPDGSPIDYSAAKGAGYTYTFMKSTEGIDYTDDWFARDWKAAADSGILRAPYHFYHPAGPGDGAQQAEFFVKTIKEQGYTGKNAGELPPVLDLEQINGGCPPSFDTGQVKAWLDTVHNSLGVKPIVYTSKPFVDQCMGGDGALFSGYLLWQPRYGSGDVEPQDIPGAGAPWQIWQHASDGQVPGVPDDAVDVNVYRNSLEELQKLAGGGDGGGDPSPSPSEPADGKAFPTWGTRWVVHETADPDSKAVGMINGSDVTVDYQVNSGQKVCEGEECSTYMAHITGPEQGFLSVVAIDVEESKLTGVPVRD